MPERRAGPILRGSGRGSPPPAWMADCGLRRDQHDHHRWSRHPARPRWPGPASSRTGATLACRGRTAEPGTSG